MKPLWMDEPGLFILAFAIIAVSLCMVAVVLQSMTSSRKIPNSEESGRWVDHPLTLKFKKEEMQKGLPEAQAELIAIQRFLAERH
jgi:hypothetical protein